MVLNLDAYIIDATTIRKKIVKDIALLNDHITNLNEVCSGLESIVNFKRFPAVYSYNLEQVEKLHKRFIKKFNYKVGYLGIRNDYRGFYLSNLRIWEKFYNTSNHDYVMIMKDEVRFNVKMPMLERILHHVIKQMELEKVAYFKFTPYSKPKIVRERSAPDTSILFSNKPLTFEKLKNPLVDMDYKNARWSSSCYIIHRERFLKEWMFNKNIEKLQRIATDQFYTSEEFKFKKKAYRLDTIPITYIDNSTQQFHTIRKKINKK